MVKSPTKANANHHHGDFKIQLLISDGNEIKSVWLVISEAGNAVCGVV